MSPHRRESSGFRDIRTPPNSTFYAELRVDGFRLTLGTFDTPKLASHAT
jgi:hypothetical protein